MKKRYKRLSALAFAALMAVSSITPAFAYTIRPGTSSNEIMEGTDKNGWYKFAYGKQDTYPGWYWVDQYCYYFYKARDYAKNTTTPDGYTVDEQGRWTVDGVVQTNNYGHEYFNTDTLYAGKNDDQRWEIMQGLLEKEYAKGYGTKMEVAMISNRDNVRGFAMSGGYGGGYGDWIQHFSDEFATGIRANDYLEWITGSTWSDGTLVSSGYGYVGSAATAGASFEKTAKILLGDHTGQELFDQVRAAAEPVEGGPFEAVKLNEDGSPANYYTEEFGVQWEHSYMETLPVTGDGINWDRFDMSKWQNRKTDYGKSFTLSVDSDKVVRITIKR